MSMEQLTAPRLSEILSGIDRARVGVLGDFCMDMYWHADMTRSTLSRETPHFPLPVISEKMSPGAAGNVASNIAALKPASLMIFGAAGRDWRGAILREALFALGAEVHLIECEGRTTNAYIKPMLHGFGDAVQEAARLDFENDQPLPAWAEDQLIAALTQAADRLDVLCVCDQMVNGCVTLRVREAIMDLAQNGLRVIADSRENIACYEHVIVKPNEIESARALGQDIAPEQACLLLAQKNHAPAIVTAGEDGCYLSDGDSVVHIPAQKVAPPLDICGAGDTFLSAFACTLAGGASAAEAAQTGNLASSVTIRKIGMTGTASRGEILTAYADSRN